jgi:hypothetical protein
MVRLWHLTVIDRTGHPEKAANPHSLKSLLRELPILRHIRPLLPGSDLVGLAVFPESSSAGASGRAGGKSYV